MKLDKNGHEIQVGASVRLTQTMADYQLATRLYEIKEIGGELFITLPVSELRNEGTNYHSLETVR